jgi:hypothetical protein
LFRGERLQKLTIVWSPTVNVYKRAMIMIVKHFLYTTYTSVRGSYNPVSRVWFTNSRILKLTCDCTLVNFVIYCINTSFIPLPHVQSKAEQGNKLTFLSNSFKRSEHFFRRRISPSFKNDIIRLEAGAFKFLRNRLFMTSMQFLRKRDVPSSTISKMSRSLPRRRENSMRYSAR